jgi:hypothetical protein
MTCAQGVAEYVVIPMMLLSNGFDTGPDTYSAHRQIYCILDSQFSPPCLQKPETSPYRELFISLVLLLGAFAK